LECRTNGKVIFASGSPYKPIALAEKTVEPGQGNNMYIFPGIGLGALIAKASRVTDSMVEQASVALAGSLDANERVAGLIYPRLDRIREISAMIALAVVRAAQDAVRFQSQLGDLVIVDMGPISQSVDGAPTLRHVTDNTLLTYIKEQMWDPRPLKSHF
jgi:malate dehydrogenase (oxaloacetate-decarboxylating)(NADP+)